MNPPQVKVLRLYLHQPAGDRRLIGHLTAYGDLYRVVFDDSYTADPDRPTLSMAYQAATEEATVRLLTDQRHGHLSRLDRHWPAYFMNLLPEGHNRTRLALERGCSEDDEFELLAAAGHDLMGAIEVEPLPIGATLPPALRQGPGALPDGPSLPADVAAPIEDGASLPGVVEKFSAVKDGRRYVVKRRGEAGSYIIKLPTTRHPDLVQNEYTGYRLLQALGLTCAQAEIVDSANAELPEHIEFPQVLAVQRFDRRVLQDGPLRSRVQRIHFEEFCQVLGYEPSRKYGTGLAQDFAPMLSLLARLSPERRQDLQEWVARLVAFILMGNCDAHLKNWGLLYPDGRRPQLAPVYDPVCVAAFFDSASPKDYALNRAIDATLKAFGPADLESLLVRARLTPRTVKGLMETARETVLLARQHWPDVLADAPTAVRRTVLARLSDTTALAQWR